MEIESRPKNDFQVVKKAFVEIESKNILKGELTFQVSVLGGKETIWEGVCADFEVHVPENFPVEGPRVRCLSPFPHPGLLSDGRVYLPKNKFESIFFGNDCLVTCLEVLFSSRWKGLEGPGEKNEEMFREIRPLVVFKWTPSRHFYFGEEFRDYVKLFLLCYHRNKKEVSKSEKAVLGILPKFIILEIIGASGRIYNSLHIPVIEEDPSSQPTKNKGNLKSPRKTGCQIF